MTKQNTTHHTHSDKNAWYLASCAPLHHHAAEQAAQHQNQLTKPQGSLGYLERLCIDFARWQNNPHPKCNRIMVRIFAGDHGIAKQAVSAYPQEVTTQMVHNFLQGGAAISVLAQNLSADFAVVNAGVKGNLNALSHPLLIHQAIANGTQDFSQQAAMTSQQLEQALELGKISCVHRTKEDKNTKIDLMLAGDMGIGNTTSASALYCALLNISAEQSVGSGTGITLSAMEKKRTLISNALALHQNNLSSPLSILQHLGGFEIAAIVGAYIYCAQQGIAILVDGFICTAAALVACRINPSVRHWMLFAHQSAEPAHQYALDELNATPLLQLRMRLGEGSGAAIAIPLIQNALLLHNNMATFDSAKVSNKQD